MDIDKNIRKKSVLWILIKLKLLEMLKGSNSKRRTKLTKKKIAKITIGTTGLIILYIVSFLAIAISIGLLFGLVAMTTAGKSYSWVYFSYMAIGMFLLSFVGSVFIAENQMFQAKDNETLASMPIKPWDILVSRIISMLIWNGIFGAIIGIPAGIVYVYFRGFSFIKFIYYILALILVPLLALSCAMLAGWLLNLLSSKVKNTKIFRLAIAVVAMMLYFYFVFSDGGWVNNLAQNAQRFSEGIKTYIPPAYSVGMAIHKKSFIHMLLMLLWHIVPFIVVTIIVSRNFLRIITGGKDTKSVRYKSKGIKVRSLRASYLKLETERFFSSVSYIMNGGMGLLLLVLMAFFSFSKDGDLAQVVQALKTFGLPSQGVVPFSICAAILGLMSLVIISASTISLDANTLWLLKSMPIKGKDVILAKSGPHILISLPFILLAGIVIQIGFDMSIIERVLIILIPITATVFNALLGVRININHPKFNWTNETQAVKQGMAPLLAMLFNSLPVLIFVPGFMYLVFYKRFLTGTVYLILMEIIYIVLTLWMYLWTCRKGDKAIDNLEN